MLKSKKQFWGWCFYDWASQPYHTLLLTFVFGPYIAQLLGDGSRAQALWGYNLTIVGLLVACLSPLLGTLADRNGKRLLWIKIFSLFYVVGSFGLWWSEPGNFNLIFLLLSFAIGLIGTELTALFSNSLMSDLADKQEMGKVSGAGWAFGYAGGVLSLLLMLCFFAQNSKGLTYIGLQPGFGFLDAARQEGTRAVGPFTALWYIIFMIPFFLWLKEDTKKAKNRLTQDLKKSALTLFQSFKNLKNQSSLAHFLLASMLYRDALNGINIFGGVYAVGVLNWSISNVGIFGIVAALSGAIFTSLGGLADYRFGSKKVIVIAVSILCIAVLGIVALSADGFLGFTLGATVSKILFYIFGALIGAGGGILQASSRALMIHQASEGHVSEVCGLYAFSGKVTAFLAPLLVGSVTDLTNSQRWGITPIIALLFISLILLKNVHAVQNR